MDKTGNSSISGKPASSPIVRIPAPPARKEAAAETKAAPASPPPTLRRAHAEDGSSHHAAPAESAATGVGTPQPMQSALNIKVAKPEEKLGPALSPPPPPKPAMAPQPRSARSVWMVRSLILVFLFTSLWLLYWSVFVRLLPVIAQHREKALEMTRTADELDRLRSRWTQRQIDETKEQFARAQEALFHQEAELIVWEEDLRNEARMRVLAAELERKNPEPSKASADGINAITANLSISPEDIFGSTNSPYKRLIHFTDALARSPKRLDLVDLSVVGNSNSISQAHAVVQVFATERKAL